MTEGQVLAGKYRVERVLGAGGMGIVVAAHHLHLDEKVAIKFLLPETFSSPETLARFAREARAAAKIKSEHVARVIDVGKLDNGAPYTVMEYLDGIDLAAWLRQRGPLASELAVDFVLQACEAVAEAHVLGIVHRDLKPANLFIIRRPDGQLSIKVLDFGISKVAGSSATGAAAMTATSAIMGSPLYMSPEQMHSASTVDARTDLWALGVVLYEALAGVPPFRGETLPEVCAMILTNKAPSLRAVLPDLPPGLDAVVQRCLEKDREQRFRDVGEVAAPLAAFGSEHARLSARRIAGVLSGGGLSAVAPPPTGAAPVRAAGVTLAAPEGTMATPGGLTPQFVGTEHPVASTLAGRVRTTPTQVRMWTGGGVLLLAGAIAVFFAHGAHEDIGHASASASVSFAPPLERASSPLAPDPPPPSTAASASEATPSVGAAFLGIPSSIGTPSPRPRVNAKPPPVIASSRASASTVESSVPPRPVAAASASASPRNCRLVSNFDLEGNQHFKQVCDGN